MLGLTLRGVRGNPTSKQILELRANGKAFESSQSSGRYALIASIVESHSLFFTKEIALYATPDLGTVHGKYVSLFAPGVSFIAIPFYLLGKFFNFAQLVTFSLSSVFALINLVLIFLIIKKLTNNRIVGLIAALIFIFSTSSWSYALMLNQHHVTTALILACTYLILFPVKWYRTLLFSFLFGFSFIIEYPNMVFFIPLILFLIIKHFSIEEMGRHIKIKFNTTLLIGLVGVVIGILPNFWYNQQANGSYFTLAGSVKRVLTIDQVKSNSDSGDQSSIGGQKSAIGLFTTNNLPISTSVLFTSKDRGLLFFAPILLLGLLGIKPLLKKNKIFAYSFLGTIGIIFLLYGMWGDPWGGWTFGPRYLIPAFALLSILVGVGMNKYGRKVWFFFLFTPLFLYSTFVSLVGALTTTQIPPSVEKASADLLPKLTYLYNFDLVKQGKSGSFAYNTFLSKDINLISFAIIMFSAVFIIVFILYALSLRTGKVGK